MRPQGDKFKNDSLISAPRSNKDYSTAYNPPFISYRLYAIY